MSITKPSTPESTEYQQKRHNLLLSFQRNELAEPEYQKMLFDLDFSWVLKHFSMEHQIILKNYFEEKKYSIKEKSAKLSLIFGKCQKMTLEDALNTLT